jgi:hypothetical protein
MGVRGAYAVEFTVRITREVRFGVERHHFRDVRRGSAGLAQPPQCLENGFAKLG